MSFVDIHICSLTTWKWSATYSHLLTHLFIFDTVFRKPIIPQKEPSPLLEKKIQLLEAKFAELEGGDDDIEEMGEEDSEVIEPPSLPQLQTPLASELDLMPYTPPQVKWHAHYLPCSQLWSAAGSDITAPVYPAFVLFEMMSVT